MADVYAMDDEAPVQANDAAVLFVVVADPDPDALARIAGTVQLGNISPRSAAMTTRADGLLVVSLEVCGLAGATIDLIRRKLAQLSTVYAAEAHPVTVLKSAVGASLSD